MLAPKALPYLYRLRKLVLLAFLCGLPLADSLAHVGPTVVPLREKDVRRAESIIRQLRRLEHATTSTGFRDYQALTDKSYPGLFIRVSELRDSDLKTDLTTAVFLYEEALHRLKDSATININCEDELRDIYVKACVEKRSRTPAALLWAKARLHTDWADATLKYHQGIKDEQILGSLKEMRRARQNDLILAERAVEILRTLERNVRVYPSLAEFEASGALAGVPFERLSQEVADALLSIDGLLRSLPRGPLFYPLYHARNAYSDGVFWWQKTYRQRRLVVNANSFSEPEELKSVNLDPALINYTVVVNWRKAIHQTRQAERIIETLKARS
jgi:hypothetical protein